MTEATAAIPSLVADIGGTNARFALLSPGGGLPNHVVTMDVHEFPTLVDAAATYLKQQGVSSLAEAAIAIANPVTGDRVSMTNHHWSFSVEQTRQQLRLERLLLINDFTALALALPLLQPHELQQVGGGAPGNGAKALLGPGTGLGVSGLLPAGSGQWIPVSGEGGHATLAPGDAREARIIDACRERHGHVSAERLLSGIGLPSLHEAIASLSGDQTEPLATPAIIEKGLSNDDPHCKAALETFCSLLGNFAGNLALTLGAHGGVYMGGGIVPRLGEFFALSSFRARFEQKGRFSTYLKPIPVYVIHAHEPALRGAAAALRHALCPGVDARRVV